MKEEAGGGSSLEPTRYVVIGKIKVYVAAVNVYNCRGRRQVYFVPGDGHVPSVEAPPGRRLGFITLLSGLP